MDKCEGCKEVLQEVKGLEATQDRRYDDYLKRVIEYEIDKAKNIASMKSLHKRLDDYADIQAELNRVIIKHMKEEEDHYIEMSRHMSKTNQLLEHLATKNNVTKVNGRINTVWVVGPLVLSVFIAIAGIFVWYIKEDIKLHNKEYIIKAV